MVRARGEIRTRTTRGQQCLRLPRLPVPPRGRGAREENRTLTGSIAHAGLSRARLPLRHSSVVRSARIELARDGPTRLSTWRVYRLRHDRDWYRARESNPAASVCRTVGLPRDRARRRRCGRIRTVATELMRLVCTLCAQRLCSRRESNSQLELRTLE